MTALKQAQNNESLKILVIDDNPDDRELYKRLLKKKTGVDFEIHETDNAKEGLYISQMEKLDCIIVDYRLPDATGIDFIHSYKEIDVDSATAIVMVTGQGDEGTAVNAMKLGALDYIQKSSITQDFFAQKILNAIERAQLKSKVLRYQYNLERSNQALLEFAYTAAHDLKGPARRITSYCELLKEDMSDRLGSEGLGYVDRMMINSRRLQKLIDDLLNYSRAMHSKEETANVDLKKVIHEITDDLETIIRENNATIIAENLPTITAYPLRIKQLFQNLVANAIKYRSQKDPVVTITCRDEGKYYLFAVSDNGIGIAKNFQEGIFKPFERLHSHEDIEGSGLGLAICRKAVNMHKGKIWVESKPGEGATFYFTISK